MKPPKDSVIKNHTMRDDDKLRKALKQEKLKMGTEQPTCQPTDKVTRITLARDKNSRNQAVKKHFKSYYTAPLRVRRRQLSRFVQGFSHLYKVQTDNFKERPSLLSFGPA